MSYQYVIIYICLFLFRYTLTDNRTALAKFLLSVDWSSESEITELPTLLDLWKVNTAIHFDIRNQFLTTYFHRPKHLLKLQMR
jgi:hypothetical protein